MNALELNENETLAISHLNALEYCPRRFYYESVLGEFQDNEHIIEGLLYHERSDTGKTTVEDGIVTRRRVWIWSERLRVSGFADIVEEDEQQIIPIEYKKGKMGEWLNDHIQLCAQALCLEEMTGRNIPLGYIFYFGSTRREEILFNEELRLKTEETIRYGYQLSQQDTLPPPLIGKQTKRSPLPTLHNKCRDCSLEPICLPREVLFHTGPHNA